jgi:hypothetical protein
MDLVDRKALLEGLNSMKKFYELEGKDTAAVDEVILLVLSIPKVPLADINDRVKFAEETADMWRDKYFAEHSQAVEMWHEQWLRDQELRSQQGIYG